MLIVVVKVIMSGICGMVNKGPVFSKSYLHTKVTLVVVTNKLLPTFFHKIFYEYNLLPFSEFFL